MAVRLSIRNQMIVLFGSLVDDIQDQTYFEILFKGRR